MKKGLLVLIAVIILLVCQCAVSFGDSAVGIGDASIYLEGRLSTQDDLQSAENNWGSGVLGINASVGRCKVAVESFSKAEQGDNFQSTNTKVGFALINDEMIRFDATVSYHKSNLNGNTIPSGSVDCNGYLIGLDLQLALSETTVLEAALGYIANGTWEASSTHSDMSVLTYKFKYDWMPWENFGFSVGYRYYSYRPNSISNSETDFNEIYCGIVLRFRNIEFTDGGPVQIWGR